MVDQHMTCVVGIAEDKALVCTEKGDICLLDEALLRLSKIANAEFGVSCITIDADSKFAWVAGRHGQIRYARLLIEIDNVHTDSLLEHLFSRRLCHLPHRYHRQHRVPALRYFQMDVGQQM